MAGEVKIAVASDLHCASSDKSSSESLVWAGLPRLSSKVHPVEGLLELIRAKSISAHLLVVPGDVANRASPAGIAEGWSMMREVRDALNAQAVVGTIGNHDVQFSKDGGNSLDLPRNAHSDFPFPDQRNHPEYWADGLWTAQYGDLRIVSINSIKYFDEERCKRGHLPDGLIKRLHELLGDNEGVVDPLRVAVCHHHPMVHSDMGMETTDVLENGDRLLATLGELGFGLLIHGHKHAPRLIESPEGGELHVFAAGSLSGLPRGLSSSVGNLFHVITLEVPDDGASVYRGIVDTWQFRSYRGWRDASREGTEFPARTGFGAQQKPEALAKSTAEWFEQQGSPRQEWCSALSAESEILYLIPGDFGKYVEALQKKHNLWLNYTETGAPFEIGRRVGGNVS